MSDTPSLPPAEPPHPAEPPADGVTAADGYALVRYAAEVVHHRLGGGPVGTLPVDRPALRRPGASFVTLERSGALRGCVGSLDARLPLYRDVAHNAVRATADPRLSPVRLAEWPTLDVSVSVLSPHEVLTLTGAGPAEQWAHLCAVLRPGRDGLVITVGGRRATFLPVVWERLTDPARFLAALLAKGGWPAGRLPAGAVVRRYYATSFHGPAAGREE